LFDQWNLSVLKHTHGEPLLEVDIVARILVAVDALAHSQYTTHQIQCSLDVVFLLQAVRVLVVNGLELLTDLVDHSNDMNWADIKKLVQHS
jgi:hypothetical protein